MPQADAQHRLAHADRGLGQLGLRLQPRVLVVVGGPHRPAHDHHAGQLVEIRHIRFLLPGHVERERLQTQILKIRQNPPRFLPRDVLQNKHLR